MVHIVGAGPGDPELITVKGRRYLEEADVVIYAGSLVNPALLAVCREDAVIHNSAKMTLDEVIAVIEEAEAVGKMTVRLHTGDPAIGRQFVSCSSRCAAPGVHAARHLADGHHHAAAGAHACAGARTAPRARRASVDDVHLPLHHDARDGRR